VSDFEIVTLRNGARALRERSSGEIMHPSVGPWAEANLLYVEQSGLAARLAQGSIRVLDVGLGGAANAVAALAAASEVEPTSRHPLEIISFDRTLEPLKLALADPGSFPFLLPWQPAVKELLEHGRWTGPGLTWRFVPGDFRDQLDRVGEPVDIVFFDPFSPNSAPDQWSAEVFAAVRKVSRTGGRGAQLFTYSAATPTRVSLLMGGWFVGAGVSVATKAETTVGSTELAGLAQPLGERWLERWRRSTNRAPHGAAWAESVARSVETHPQFLDSPGPSRQTAASNK